MLPLPVLERAASELVSYGDSGMSVLEMSHRSPDYEPIIKAAEASLRKLMNIPDEYAVLFLQGGASTQFAAVPLNLMPEGGKADYIVSGQFSGKAYTEALKYGDAAVAATSKPDNFTYVPATTRASTRYTAPNSIISPTPAISRSLRICPPASSPSRWTSGVLPSYMPARRKTLLPRD